MPVVRKNVSIPKWMERYIEEENKSLSKILQKAIEEEIERDGWEDKGGTQ